MKQKKKAPRGQATPYFTHLEVELVGRHGQGAVDHANAADQLALGRVVDGARQLLLQLDLIDVRLLARLAVRLEALAVRVELDELLLVVECVQALTVQRGLQRGLRVRCALRVLHESSASPRVVLPAVQLPVDVEAK